jgi:hypothetical protein
MPQYQLSCRWEWVMSHKIISSDKKLRSQFKKHLGDQEIFKFVNDVIENSQNILIVIDGEKSELS